MPNRQEIIDLLRQVKDPELHISITDLDMVRDVQIENGHVKLTIALTVPSCPLSTTIEKDAKAVLSALNGIASIDVTMTSMTKEERERAFAKLGRKTGVGIERMEKHGIKNILAITSGKGGVGKSIVTALLAIDLKKQGYEVGILDADITGPSQAKIFGVEKIRTVVKRIPDPNMPNSIQEVASIAPALTKSGIELVSMNLLLKKPDEPTIWRGPILHNIVTQLFKDVEWSPLDYLLVDVPPGTSDIPLTLYQTFPLDGIAVVATPQDLVALIVKKAINMARHLKVPIVGLVENMSYAQCGKCGEKIELFGSSRGESTARAANIPFLGSLPIDPKISELCDTGRIESYENPMFAEISRRLLISCYSSSQVNFIDWALTTTPTS